jgi:hypothetical protein
MFGTTRKGLFGAPMAGSPYQTPGFGIDRSADGMSPVARDAVVPTYKKPSTAQLIVGTLGDTLSQISGGRGNFLSGLQEHQKYAQQATLQSQLYQQRRTDEYTDWERKKQYEAAHPKAPTDDAFTSTLRNAGIDPASPQARALYMQRAQTLASPAPNFVSDGAGGGRWVQPPAPGTMGTAPQAPVGKLTPLGGAGGAPSQGARTFPVR